MVFSLSMDVLTAFHGSRILSISFMLTDSICKVDKMMSHGLATVIFLEIVFPSLVWGAAKAGYLDHVSFMSQEPGSSILDYTEDYSVQLHDSDVKIPGRHYPKRPYMQQVLEDSPNLFHPTNLGHVNHLQNSEPQIEIEETPLTVGPSFERNLTRNIITQAGKTATLSCRVHNMNETSISFIRLRDLHILSVDKYKYSTDERISIAYEQKNGTWILKIRNSKKSDSGKYECQVSTKPVLSFIVNLEVVVPRAFIVNSPDIFVHRGSLMNLTCVVNHGINQLVYIYWYHENKLVDIETRRLDVEMLTSSKGQTISQLLVYKARSIDSGKYNCKPSNGDLAVVNVHVLNGEQQAAMQTNKSSTIKWNVIVIHYFLIFTWMFL